MAVTIRTSGPLFEGDIEGRARKAINSGIHEMGEIAAGLAQSAWSDKGTYAETLGVFESADKPYALVRSRYYGRPYPGRATRAAAGGPILSTWLGTGKRGGVKLRRGNTRWRQIGTAIKALDAQDWFAGRLVQEFD